MGASAEVLEMGSYEGRLSALTATIEAMRWATRRHPVEAGFWDETIDSLILCADAHVGLAELLINGIRPKLLAGIADEVFASTAHRFGRRFRVHRPFARWGVDTKQDLVGHLNWLISQSDISLMVATTPSHRSWVAIKAVDDGRLIPVAKADNCPSDDLMADAVVPKAVIAVERLFD
jgi:hypothetical protein